MDLCRIGILNDAVIVFNCGLDIGRFPQTGVTYSSVSASLSASQILMMD